jgi:hypothetical protein
MDVPPRGGWWMRFTWSSWIRTASPSGTEAVAVENVRDGDTNPADHRAELAR